MRSPHTTLKSSPYSPQLQKVHTAMKIHCSNQSINQSINQSNNPIINFGGEMVCVRAEYAWVHWADTFLGEAPFQAYFFYNKYSSWPVGELLPGGSHGRRNLVGCSPWGRKESDTTERFHFHFSLSCIGEGNGNPLQCSCLENPRDGGAWWAAIYGVAQSRTRLK